MLELIQAKAAHLAHHPNDLLISVKQILKQASIAHHLRNNLLPASDIQILLIKLQQNALVKTNIQASIYLVSAYSMVLILKSNFKDLIQNKLFSALVLNYVQRIQQIMTQIKIQRSNLYDYTKFISRGLVLSQIIYKLVQHTHVYLPQYYRFVKLSMEIILQKINQFQPQPSQIQNQNSNFLSQKIFRFIFSKKISQLNAVLIIQQLHQQVKKYNKSVTQASLIHIYEQIGQLYQKFSNKIKEIGYTFLTSQTNQTSQKTQDPSIYLQQMIKVRQLTPRFYDQQQGAELKMLRKKKLKLKKKIQNDLRNNVLIKQQEVQARDQVKRQKANLRRKKQMFVIEKQTAQARQFHKKMQKVKFIKKGKEQKKK